MTIDLQEIARELSPVFKKNAEAHDEDDTFASENYQLLKERGLFGAQPSAHYGGSGVSHSDMCTFLRQIAHACPATALSLSMHQHLVSAAILNDAAGRPGKQLLEKVGPGNVVLVSTGANDWLESNGSAIKVDGGFEVSAIKPFASGSPAGDLIVTSAIYDNPDEGSQVIHFPLSLKSDGISLLGDWKTMGMRATGSQTIKMSKVFVPDKSVALRRPRGGFHPAFAVILGVALPLIMSAYTGVAEAAAEIAREKAAARAGDPVTPFLLGEMENLLTTAQLAQSDMVAIADDLKFLPTIELASKMLIRKTICASHVIATAEKAVEVVGGAGFFRRLGLERILRDAHAAQFHPLPEKRQQLFCGRLSMGLDPVPSQAPAQ
jgi:alkylation response protein AidB-like acyl-CoA dehydrogenase